MLIYTENHETGLPFARIHNLDTGITYILEVLGVAETEEPDLVVSLRAADGNGGWRAFRGQEAVDFWKALLFRNPHNGSAAAPSTFIARALGVETAEPVVEEDIPF